MTVEKYCISDPLCWPNAMKIKVIYDVNATGEYDVKRWLRNYVDYIAVLTRAGNGLICLKDGEITVGPGELLLIAANQLRAYRTLHDVWSFLWFEFDGSYLPIPPYTVHHLAKADWKEELCQQCLDLMLQKKDETASALFTTVCYFWKDALGEQELQESETMLNQSIDFVKANIRTVTVKDLAEHFFISERTLRNLYYRYTGRSPSQMIKIIRMKEAQRLLVSSVYTIGEISDLLGYANPFYFSKMFSAHIGMTPSEYRKQANLQKSEGGK